jgi:hypothetical protein
LSHVVHQAAVIDCVAVITGFTKIDKLVVLIAASDLDVVWCLVQSGVQVEESALSGGLQSSVSASISWL